MSDNPLLLNAYLMMTKAISKNQKRNYKINSKIYDSLKKDYSNFKFIEQSGECNTNFGMKWIKNDNEKIQMKLSDNETKEYLKNGWAFGRNMSYKNLTKIRKKEIKIKKNNKRLNNIKEKTRLKYLKIYNDWKQSGLNLTKFCKSNNLNNANIRYRFSNYLFK